jgi:hypothetical protein
VPTRSLSTETGCKEPFFETCGGVCCGVLAKIVEQAWEMGKRELILIHGHGRNRGITPGFVNTNTGFFGLQKKCLAT